MIVLLGLDNSKDEVTRRFYARLIPGFVPEQHGDKGLPHLAAEVPSVAVEVYPSIKGMPRDAICLGFEVADPDAVKGELIALGGCEVEPPVPTTRSGIATLRDPRGVLVRLFPS